MDFADLWDIKKTTNHSVDLFPCPTCKGSGWDPSGAVYEETGEKLSCPTCLGEQNFTHRHTLPECQHCDTALRTGEGSWLDSPVSERVIAEIREGKRCKECLSTFEAMPKEDVPDRIGPYTSCVYCTSLANRMTNSFDEHLSDGQ